MSCVRDKISRLENSNIKEEYFKIISILSGNTITRLTFFFYSCEFGVCKKTTKDEFRPKQTRIHSIEQPKVLFLLPA